MTVIARIRPRGTALALVVAVAAGLAGSAVASAQETAGDAVVARVDGDPITEGDLAVAAQEFRDELPRMPGDLRSNLIDLIVNIRLGAKAAKQAGMNEDPPVAARLALVEDQALYAEFLRRKFVAAVTEEAVRAEFDEELAAFVPADQVHVRHILVATEEEAKEIIAELDAGADFAEVAKEKSLDGSGANGGDLDFIWPGRTVKPFEDAAYALKVGEYTKEPVQTNFGWHVIKSEETRKEPPPTFAQEARQIQQQLMAATFEEAMNALRAEATIEVVPVAEPETEANPADAQ